MRETNTVDVQTYLNIRFICQHVPYLFYKNMHVVWRVITALHQRNYRQMQKTQKEINNRKQNKKKSKKKTTTKNTPKTGDKCS